MARVASQRQLGFVAPAYQALGLWLVFFVANILINGTLPFALGRDLRSWSQSPVKYTLVGFLIYSLLFLVVPLVLLKGWETVRQKSFLLPLCLAVLAITFSLVWRGVNTIAVVVLAYLHWRFDLSALGIRSRAA